MIVASFSIWYVQEQRRYEYLDDRQKRYYPETNPELLCTASGTDELGEWLCPRKSRNTVLPGRCSYHIHRVTQANNAWMSARRRGEDARLSSPNVPPPEAQQCGKCGERKWYCYCQPEDSKSLKRAEKYYLRNQRRKRGKRLKDLVPNARKGKWSAAEDRVVMSDELSLKELAVLLQRSYTSVSSRRSKLRRLCLT